MTDIIIISNYNSLTQKMKRASTNPQNAIHSKPMIPHEYAQREDSVVLLLLSQYTYCPHRDQK